MRRREFIALFGGTVAAWPSTAPAQPTDKIVRIGFFGLDRSAPIGAASYQTFVDEMKIHGFINDQNLVVDFRRLEQDSAGLSSDMSELVQLNVNALVTQGTEPALKAAIGASRTVPIVMIATNFDPFAGGYVKSLARPGGNVTGLFLRQTELAEKQTELLLEAVPDKKRLGILWDLISAAQFSAAERRAKAFGLEVNSVKLENPHYDFEAAFRTLVATSPQMLLVLSSPYFTPSRARIAELAISNKLPTMFIFKTYAEAGGLLSYGADYIAMHRQAATQVVKILRGTKPADIPNEQPNRYEFVVNLKTAKAIGIELPTSILLRADEVIE